ncbi:MAG: Rieske 2Fe-2S domain-containing protein [Bacteroidota bacterium]|nr:Rieske 2Fe-2S domain-containing protein [Bacteroidota bacterium]
MHFKKQTKWFKIFDAEFLKENQLKLKVPITVEVGNKTVCLVKLPEGYFAVSDICPHQGASLSEGYCTDQNIVCPWHHYEFNLKSGRQAEGGGDYVMTFPVEIRKDGLYIGIERNVFSLF